MSASAASTTGSALRPTEATTSPALSSTARSARSASAARSTATRLAVRSSSADETIARKPVSCCTDQLPDAPGAEETGTSDEACCECTPIGPLSGSGPGADHIDVRRGNLSLLQALPPQLVLLGANEHPDEHPDEDEHQRHRLLDHHDHAGNVLVLDRGQV